MKPVPSCAIAVPEAVSGSGWCVKRVSAGAVQRAGSVPANAAEAVKKSHTSAISVCHDKFSLTVGG
jgi:hypothetical protein